MMAFITPILLAMTSMTGAMQLVVQLAQDTQSHEAPGGFDETDHHGDAACLNLNRRREDNPFGPGLEMLFQVHLAG